MTNLRKWFAISSVLLLLLIFVIALDTYNQEWKRYQRAFLVHVFTEKARAEKGELSLLDRFMVAVNAELSLGIRKVVTEVGRSADLCMTCHANMGIAGFTHNPLKDLLESHVAIKVLNDLPLDQVGCTACHGGDALALGAETAHHGMRTRFGEIFEESLAKLSSERWADRQKGIERIRWMTANDFGFRFSAPQERREEAIARIVQWWEINRDTFITMDYGERSSPFRTENLQRENFLAQRTDISPVGEPLSFVGSATCVACHAHPEISDVYIPESSKQHVERWFRKEFMTSTNPEAYLKHPAITLLIEDPQRRQELDEYLRKWEREGGDLDRTKVEDLVETMKRFDVTCEACHGPGIEYTKLMQRGMGLEAAGQSIEAAAFMSKAKEIARSNARRSISEYDPATGYSRVWAIFEHLIERALGPGQVRPTE
jgi:hypothetical protein